MPSNARKISRIIRLNALDTIQGLTTDAELQTGQFDLNVNEVTAVTFIGDGSQLTGISAGATGGGDDRIFQENGQVVTESYTITPSNNAITAGPIRIAEGAVITIPDDSIWNII